MKNIILIDICSYALETVMDNQDVFVAVLVVDSEKEKKAALKKYPDRIGKVYYRTTPTYEEFFNVHQNNYNLKYNDIEKYKSAQVKVEHYLLRETIDYNDAQYRYLIGLSYWLDVFSSYKIDAVISMHLEHGALYDSIPFEIAKAENIPVFNQNVEFCNGVKLAMNFRCINTGRLLNLKSVTKNYTPPELSKYVYNKVSAGIEPQFGLPKFDRDIVKATRRTVRNFIKNLFKSRKEKFDNSVNTYDYWYNLSPEEILKNTFYIRKLKKVYESISEKPVEGEKYIFYALHFEPEAVVMNRGSLSNQLYVIKMISQSLPKGWKLYVKEHPAQFKLSGIRFYFLRNIFAFKTKQFYGNILNNKNVKLIDLNMPSSDLIKNSVATATISGTVIIETVLENKPVLIFGNNTTTLNEVNDTFSICSHADVKTALEKLENGFVPNYNNLNSVVREYLVETDYFEIKVNSEKKQFLSDILTYILDYRLENEIV